MDQHYNQNETDQHKNKSNNLKEKKFCFSPLSLEEIRQMHSRFVAERNWDQFHSPRNILLALIGELGELAENFQWKCDADCEIGLPKWTEKERKALADELSDVLIYLIRLADRCLIDLSETILSKLDEK